MANPSESTAPNAPQVPVVRGSFADWSRSSQLDFEIAFFERIVERDRCYVDVLRALAELLTSRKSYQRGLEMDQRLARLRPEDPLVRYNLACSYALVHSMRKAIDALRTAVELGYDDFDFMEQDPDLKSIRDEPGYQQLLRQVAPLRRLRG
jgi:tetratricopeptide (TPR) repeat protein